MSVARLWRCALLVAREEGLWALASRACRFLRYLISRTFYVEHVYLCRFDLSSLGAWPVPPPPADFDSRFITSNGDAELVVAEGFEDLRDRVLRASQSLDAGCMALCMYCGQKLAHVGWMARTRNAKQRFDDVPYPVDFAHGDACIGGVFTFPDYRGRGLMAHSLRLRLDYLRASGCTAALSAVVVDNEASLKAMARVGPFSRCRVIHVKLPGINYVRCEDSHGSGNVGPWAKEGAND